MCGAPVVEIGEVLVCERCIAGVSEQCGELCSRCGEAMGWESARFAGAAGVTECSMCRMAPPEFARAVAYAAYEAESRELLHLLKFGGERPVAAHVLGSRLAEAILKLEGEAARELVVVPVPLFAARQQKRGFNQAEVLARAALKVLRKKRQGWDLRLECGALKRVRDTRSLFSLAPHQRRSSIRGAFRVGESDLVRGCEVLLVDDILTTGATARECSRVLLRAGAAKVWVATVARAQAEGVVARDEVREPHAEVAFWDAAPG